METRECRRCLFPEGIVRFSETSTGRKRSICDECFSEFGNVKSRGRRYQVLSKAVEPIRTYEENGMLVKVLPPADVARSTFDFVDWSARRCHEAYAAYAAYSGHYDCFNGSYRN